MGAPLVIALVFLYALCGCDSDLNITGPGQSPVQPDNDSVSEEEIPFNPGPVLNISDVRGTSAFGLASHDEQTQRRFLRFARNRGYNTVRVCAELMFGNDFLFPISPSIFNGALSNFKETLRIVADENMFMLAMGICTLKSSRENITVAQKEEWIKQVAKAMEPYDNAFLEVVNEWRHPRSNMSFGEVQRLIKVARRVSGGMLVGSDQGIPWPGASFVYDFKIGSDFASFHMFRNPDPNREEIRKAVAGGGGQAILSETTCWTDDPEALAIFGDGDGLCTSNKDQIKRYYTRCATTRGCVWFFHSIEGLWGADLTWMPRVQ